jgi:hypothetical protein
MYHDTISVLRRTALYHGARSSAAPVRPSLREEVSRPGRRTQDEQDPHQPAALHCERPGPRRRIAGGCVWCCVIYSQRGRDGKPRRELIWR